MAPAMFQSSKENLGGTLEKKLVWGRTKNWIGRACDLGSAAKKMLCRLRMIDFPENGDRSQRSSAQAQLWLPMHRPMIIRSISTASPEEESGWLTKTCCAQIHRFR
jgi:hypothetical protein